MTGKLNNLFTNFYCCGLFKLLHISQIIQFPTREHKAFHIPKNLGLKRKKNLDSSAMPDFQPPALKF